MTVIRLAINGYGLIGRQLATRLQKETWVKLVAINDSIVIPPNDQAEFDTTVLWLNEPAPERLPWRDLNIDVVIESARFFSRAELETQIARSNARIFMTGDLREGLPDITLVPAINGARLTPHHRIIGLGSDRTQCLLPLFHRLDDAFGFATADVVLERPPYVGREWGLRFRDSERERMSEQLERVQPGLGTKIHFLRIESPHAKLAQFRADLQLQTVPSEEQLWHIVDSNEAGACRVNWARLRLRGPRLWLEGEYDPVSDYVERLISCLPVVQRAANATAS